MSRITQKQEKSKVDTKPGQKPKPKKDSSTELNMAGSQPENKEPVVRVEEVIEFNLGQRRELVAMFRNDLSMDKKFAKAVGSHLKAIAYDCIHFHFEETPFRGELHYKDDKPEFYRFEFKWTIPGLGHTFKIERKVPYEKMQRL